MTKTGVYPGSFDPPTLAHIGIARAARDAHGLIRVDLAVAAAALGKEHSRTPSFEQRLEVIRASVAGIEGLRVVVTHAQLIVDIALGYDVVIMGADKWAQVTDPRWYGDDPSARDEALARLPELAIAARSSLDVPDRHRLPIDPYLLPVSSTGARSGRVEWMTDAARRFDDETGAWTQRRPDRRSGAAHPNLLE